MREPACESFNLMVVGEAGLGKTTLLESFFKSFKDDEAAFALFERKETARESEARRQLAEAQVQRNAAERELQAAVEKANYALCHAKQVEIAQLTETMAAISERLRELSLTDERRRNELRALREATRALRLDMKKAADHGGFVAASEFQLEANILQARRPPCPRPRPRPRPAGPALARLGAPAGRPRRLATNVTARHAALPPTPSDWPSVFAPGAHCAPTCAATACLRACVLCAGRVRARAGGAEAGAPRDLLRAWQRGVPGWRGRRRPRRRRHGR